MRNLFLFLWRYNFFLLFLFIEAVCFYLILQNNKFHHSNILNSSNAVAATINESVSSVTEYVKLKRINDALARQNAAMHSLMPDAFYIDSVLKRLSVDTIHKQQYTFMTAKVINNSVNRRSNYLTLNKGRRQGVTTEMGVIAADGIVGIVKDVSEHFCSVLSLLHKDVHISARLHNTGYIGSLVWDGYSPEYATLKDIARHVRLSKGDTIVTSSFSAIFPEGVMIGVIDEIEGQAGDNFYTLSVRLSTDFQNLSHVFIVTNILKDEQKMLEETQK